MGVKWKTVKNEFPKMEQSIKSLSGKKVNVGVGVGVLGGGEHVWLAGIHEYGCTIHAKRGQYLTVPLIPEAVGKKARGFSDLFVYQSKSGKKFLARSSKKNSLELVYWLTPSVTIPERSFLRGGFDEHHKAVLKSIDMLIPMLLDGRVSQQDMFEMVGETLATKIKEYARSLNNPPNSSITKNNKGRNNPLSDSGSMIESITYEVK